MVECNIWECNVGYKIYGSKQWILYQYMIIRLGKMDMTGGGEIGRYRKREKERGDCMGYNVTITTRCKETGYMVDVKVLK